MRTTPGILLLIIFLFLASVPAAHGQTLPFRHFTVDTGLPDTVIRGIMQDSRGYLWFGSRGGVCLFDGVEFTELKAGPALQRNSVRTIFEDRDKNIWIGTNEHGVFKWDSKELVQYSAGNGLPANRVFSIVQDKSGSLWFGTNNGAARFNGNRFDIFSREQGLTSSRVYGIISDRAGTVWFATADGAFSYRDGKFQRMSVKDGLIHDKVYCLIQDSRGNIWFGTAKGVSLYRQSKFTHYTKADGLGDNSVQTILEDRRGNIWFGTVNGLSLLQRGKFRTFTTRHGLLRNAIMKLVEDREGNIWIGSRTGVSCLYDLNILNYTKNEGLKNNAVWAILEDHEKRIWFGTEAGLSYLENGAFSHFTTGDGLIGNDIYTLMEDRSKNLWIGTGKGLSKLNRRRDSFRNYSVSDGLLNNLVLSLRQDRHGNIWIGTGKGVNCFCKGKLVEPPFDISLTRVNDIIEDRGGAMWFSTSDGLVRLKGDMITSFSTEDGLPDNELYSLLEDSRGRIWIAGGKGLSIYENNGFRNLTTVDGLPGNKCYFIVEDGRNRFWIGTSKGISCYNGSRFKTYNISSGLVANNWHQHAFLKDSSGWLWFGGFNGVSKVNPVFYEGNRIPPPIYITSVKVMEEEIPPSKAASLSYNRNYLKFGFNGLSFRVPEKVRYTCRLVGVEDEWAETAERSVSYPFLPPGDYRFQVKAVNSDGIASIKPAEIAFSISPPFWKTLWFGMLLVFTFLFILGFTIYRHMKRMQEKMAYDARTRQLVMAQKMELLGVLAAGAVHDLKNLLGVILGYSKLAEKNYQLENKSNMPIEKIKKTASTAIQVVKQILAFTRQKPGETIKTNLVTVLEEILDILKVARPADVLIHWEPPLKPVFLSINPGRFQQLVMNLCLNAFQAMPEGGELKIILAKRPADDGNNPGKIPDGQHVALEIIDTGTGIPEESIGKIFDPLFTTKPGDKGTGLGLFVVKQIVDDYKGVIHVLSEPGKGTRFIIVFKE